MINNQIFYYVFILQLNCKVKRKIKSDKKNKIKTYYD